MDGSRPRDRRPAYLGGDRAHGRVRARQPPAVHLARPGARRPGRRGAGRRARRREPAARAASGRRRSCGPVRRARCSRALGIGRELAPREEVDLLVVGGGPAGPRAQRSTARRRDSRRWSSRAPRSAARPAPRAGSRTTSGSRPGSPGTELTSRAVTQARKFSARTATPYRGARARCRGTAATSSGSRTATTIVGPRRLLATGAQYRRLPVDGLERLRGGQRVLRRRARPRPSAAARRASASSAAATRPGRPPSGSPAAARS